MRFRSSRALPLTAGVALAVALLAGCDQGADTSNGVTPGPPLPAGVTLAPGAVHFQPAIPATPTK